MDHYNRHDHHLAVNKIGKAIRKSPLHNPNYHRPPPPQPPSLPQPHVYNISKNDFRSVVQQLTGTPSRDPSPAPPPPSSRPPPPPQKSPSMRLQKIRPPPLAPITRPPPPRFHNPNPNPSFFPRPPHIAESPVSAYMKYLESSLLYSDGRTPIRSPGSLPSPQFPPFPSPRANPYPHPYQNPNLNPHQGLLPSPGLSPSSFLNLLSPKSPYPLLSPGFQSLPPLTPSFSFSPMAQSGILGPGPGSHPQPPPSSGLSFPQSPSGFPPIISPRWKNF